MFLLKDAVYLIDHMYPKLCYDHRHFIDPDLEIPEWEGWNSENFRVHYACFKFAVSRVLQPRQIVEIGVRTGIAAIAMLHGTPTAEYIGIDNNYDGVNAKRNFLEFTEHQFRKLNFDAQIMRMNSQSMDKFVSADLIHIDGCHTRPCAAHDVEVAIRSGIEWILVDDGDADAVFSGTMDGIFQAKEGFALPIHKFKQSYGESLLIHNFTESK